MKRKSAKTPLHSLRVQTLRAAVSANSHLPQTFKNKKAYTRKNTQWRKENP